MHFDADSVKKSLEYIAATIAALGAIWKFVLPAARRMFGLEIVYAARVAELMLPKHAYPASPINPVLIIGVELFNPMHGGFPSYSDWSSERPNWPPRAVEDGRHFFEDIRQNLSGLALEQANIWEQTIPPGLILLGLGSSTDEKLYLTYTRLRWFLLDQCHSDYARVSKEVGQAASEAVRTLEVKPAHLLENRPTRVLIVRVANRSSKDAKDLRIDLTAGGAIYDVTLNEERTQSIVSRTSTRFTVTFPVMQPGFSLELKLWYVWKSVSFGCRSHSQFEMFPGFEGMLINYIGISNGRVRARPKLLDDLRSWKSMTVMVGPDPEYVSMING
jgi:hypothetical protein